MDGSIRHARHLHRRRADIDLGTLNISEAESQIQAGEIDPILVLKKDRMAKFPDYASAGELGIDAYFSTIRGFVTLKGASTDTSRPSKPG